MNRTYECKEAVIAFLEGQLVRAREYNSMDKTVWPYRVTKLADFDDQDFVFRIFGVKE
jgi:hypothetical protein